MKKHGNQKQFVSYMKKLPSFKCNCEPCGCKQEKEMQCRGNYQDWKNIKFIGGEMIMEVVVRFPIGHQKLVTINMKMNVKSLKIIITF